MGEKMSEDYFGNVATVDQQLKSWLDNLEETALIGTVHSVFNKVINVLSIDQSNLLTLALDDVISSPWMMKTTDAYLFDKMKSEVAPGDVVRLSKKDTIELNQMEWNYTTASTKYTKIEKKNPTQLILTEAFPNAIYRFIKEQGKDSGLLSAWEIHTMKKSSMTATTNVYVNFFLQALKNMEAAIEENNKAVLNHSYGLVGLGVGLTPSGDDFLLGCLAVWQSFENPLIEQFKEKEWIENVKKRSTSVSAFMLKNGVNGYVNEALVDLLERHQEKDLSTYLSPFLKIGATSGTDMLIGVMFAYEQMNDLNGRQKNGFKSNDRKKCLS